MNSSYIPQDPSWVAPINEISGSEFPDLIIERNKENLLPAIQEYIGYEDMVGMSIVNEAEILGNLASRFHNNMAYTYIDEILIYIHNSKGVERNFSRTNKLFYSQIIKKNNLFALKDFPSHLYAIICNCLQKGRESKRSQVLIFSGVSGSGKSLNLEKGIEFLASLSNDNVEGLENNSFYEEKFNAVNSLLKVWGSIKTDIHNNSSRFMRYFQVFVSKKNKKIEGGFLNCCFLEKSRVISENNDKSSNFLIFYHILTSFPDHILKKIGLFSRKIDEFSILRSKYIEEKEGDYQGIYNSFKLLGLTEEEILTILKILSSILLFSELKGLNNEGNIIKLAEIWEIDRKTFSSYIEGLNQADLLYLGSKLYLKLFKNLVKRINIELLKEVQEGKELFSDDREIKTNIKYFSIDFLEVLGFEIYEETPILGLYPLLNNYINEKIQQFYIEALFKSEETEFLAEGLKEESYIANYKDNINIIKLYEGNILQERIFELDLMGNLKDLELKEVICFDEIQKKFVIFHTGFEIYYNYNDFEAISRKKTNIYEQFEKEILSPSLNPLFLNFLGKKPFKHKENLPLKGLSAKLNGLLNRLSKTDKCFVKCIQGNYKKKLDFNACFVLKQLQSFDYESLLSYKQKGFLIKMTYKRFYQDYSDLARFSSINLDKTLDSRKISEFIIETAIPEHYNKKKVLFGKTKVFLTKEAFNSLESKLISKVLFLRKKEALSLIENIQMKRRKELGFLRFYRKCKDISLKKKNVLFQKQIPLKLTDEKEFILKGFLYENLMKSPFIGRSRVVKEYGFTGNRNLVKRGHSNRKENDRKKTIMGKNQLLRRASSRSSEYFKKEKILTLFMSQAESETIESPNKRRKCINGKSFSDFQNKSRNTALEEYLEISSKKTFVPKETKEFPLSLDLGFNYEGLSEEMRGNIEKYGGSIEIKEKLVKNYDKVMAFQNKALEMPLLDLPKKYHKISKKCFEYILQYTGDRKTKHEPLKQVEKLLKILIESDYDSFRDEVFLQLLKQWNKNPNPVSIRAIER